MTKSEFDIIVKIQNLIEELNYTSATIEIVCENQTFTIEQTAPDKPKVICGFHK